MKVYFATQSYVFYVKTDYWKIVSMQYEVIAIIAGNLAASDVTANRGLCDVIINGVINRVNTPTLESPKGKSLTSHEYTFL